MQARKEQEQQYVALQAEHAELHLLLQKLQQDMQEAMSHHEAEREKSRSKAHELNEHIAALEDEKRSMHCS